MPDGVFVVIVRPAGPGQFIGSAGADFARGETLLRENDDWDSPAAGQAALRDAAKKVGAFALVETRDTTLKTGLDSAMLITLPPGSYTAKLSGFEGTTGIGLIEVYEVP